MRIVTRLVLGACLVAAAGPACAVESLILTLLDQPCRLLDTRVAEGGFGPLTAAHGNYKFGVSTSDITSAGQNGNSSGCSVPVTAVAISVSINQINTTAAGNIRTWNTDAGATGPSAGTAVYNPSVQSPMAGQVVFSGAATVISLGSTDQRFYLSVANGQMDMTINVVGYWVPVAYGPAATGASAVVIGHGNYATGNAAFAAGNGNEASGDGSTAVGASNRAYGLNAFAAGYASTASGQYSNALGYEVTASGSTSLALGIGATASGPGSVAIGSQSDTNSKTGSFTYSDGSAPTQNDAAMQFMVRASGGIKLYSSTNTTAGTQLASGSGSWTALSDRNAKKAVVPIDSREVLDRVVAMPLSTWQYTTQDEKFRHMGPMAQDFYSAFHLGESDTGIDTIDADGVALAAIQGLNAKLEERDREIAENNRKIAELSAQVAELAAAMKHPQGN